MMRTVGENFRETSTPSLPPPTNHPELTASDFLSAYEAFESFFEYDGRQVQQNHFDLALAQG